MAPAVQSPQSSDVPLPDATALERGRKGHTLLWLLLFGLGVLLAIGVGALVLVLLVGGDDEAAVDHGTDLAQGENSVLAGLLVPVQGYGYRDVEAAEVESTLDMLRSIEEDMGVQEGEFFVAVSLHSIVADDPGQNTTDSGDGVEVGLLTMVQLFDIPPADLHDDLLARSIGSTPIDQLTLSGDTVYVFENPAAPSSRYLYGWYRGDVQQVFDGASRPEMEQWLSAYLGAPAPKPSVPDR